MIAMSRSAEGRLLAATARLLRVFALSQALRRSERSSLERGQMAVGVKAGGSIVRMMFAVTNPSWAAQDQKEDRLVGMLAMDLGASVILPLGAAPSGSDR
jgi:hypothetical protein